MPAILLIKSVIAVITFRHLHQHLKQRRIEKLFNIPLSTDAIATLQKHVPIYARLPQDLRKELHGHINVFLADKQFYGNQGQQITDKIRMVIAGNACLLLLQDKRRKQDKKRRFTGFKSINIYPSAFVAKESNYDGVLMTETTSLRAGESWVRGPVVLSWEDVLDGSHHAEDGHNVVIHEFAHKLDEQSGHMNGLPILNDKAHYADWSKVLNEEFNALKMRTRHRSNIVLDAYGTVSPAEFFAVASESFFEKPVQMQKRLPDLYAQLRTFYNIDPASWL